MHHARMQSQGVNIHTMMWHVVASNPLHDQRFTRKRAEPYTPSSPCLRSSTSLREHYVRIIRGHMGHIGDMGLLLLLLGGYLGGEKSVGRFSPIGRTT